MFAAFDKRFRYNLFPLQKVARRLTAVDGKVSFDAAVMHHGRALVRRIEPLRVSPHSGYDPWRLRAPLAVLLPMLLPLPPSGVAVVAVAVAVAVPG